jgi:hypothetical protein
MSKRKSRTRITGPYLSGEARLEQLNTDTDLNSEQQFHKYGANPWFLERPELPPPLNRMPTVARDTLGRTYNFPLDKPNEVHVKLKRAPNRWTGERDILFPDLNDVVVLNDGREFLVENILLGEHRTNTAVLFVQWLKSDA